MPTNSASNSKVMCDAIKKSLPKGFVVRPEEKRHEKKRLSNHVVLQGAVDIRGQFYASTGRAKFF